MLREPQRKKEETQMSVSVRVVGVWEAERGAAGRVHLLFRTHAGNKAARQPTRRPGTPILAAHSSFAPCADRCVSL